MKCLRSKKRLNGAAITTEPACDNVILSVAGGLEEVSTVLARSLAAAD
jgi:hypothetical protein